MWPDGAVSRIPAPLPGHLLRVTRPLSGTQ